ncbi:MAG: hypothetical protein ACOYNS_07165, partial [Bacteroidota bacterium]
MEKINSKCNVILGIVLFLNICFAQDSIKFRDPLKWPFRSSSIWNMPIGSGARYVHAGIERAMQAGMTVDEDIIILSKNSPIKNVYINFADWNSSKDRCTKDGNVLFSAPIPDSFFINKSNWDGNTPNSSAAILLPDGITLKQTQPFSRCSPGADATSHYVFGDQNIYGYGYYGSHGGSGLSAIGGTIRIGELMPGSKGIRHALKVNIYGSRNLFYDNITKGYRWPALTADGAASSNYGKTRKNPVVKECRMGALLALPVWLKLDSLNFETVPARMLADAFQNYGAYIVDDTGWDVYAVETEWSPDGRFIKDFEKQWGFPFITYSKTNAWARDMDKIFLNLYVVENNSVDSVGGGGIPRMPLAPDFNPSFIAAEKNMIQSNKDLRLNNYPNPFNPSTTINYTIDHKSMVIIKVCNSLGQELETLISTWQGQGEHNLTWHSNNY